MENTNEQMLWLSKNEDYKPSFIARSKYSDGEYEYTSLCVFNDGFYDLIDYTILEVY